MRGSLLGRLVIRLLAVTLFFVGVALATLLLEFINQADTLRDRDLSGQARDIAHYLDVEDGTGNVSLSLPDVLRDAYDASDGMFLYSVVDSDGALLFGSRDVAGPISEGSGGLLKPNEPFRVSRPAGDGPAVFYGITVPVKRAGRTFYIQVAQGPNHSDALADEFLSELWESAAWLLGVLVLLLVGVVYVTVRSSLRPVTDISRQAAAITPATLDARLAARRLPSELVPLVDAVNNAFERIGVAYRKQREFTDNAAHELRTPIAVIRAHIESLDLDGDLLSDVARLERIVEQLLRLARADNLVLASGSRADLVGVAGQVAEMLGPDAVRNGISLALDAPAQPVFVRGDDGYLLIALRNVVENAMNAAGRGGQVRIEVDPSGAFRVADSGPGIPPADRERVFERFWRADKATDSGAGLGLSIVSRIVEAHDGSCAIDESPEGGTLFTMRLKVASGPTK